MRRRLDKDVRKADILEHALAEAAAVGWAAMTRDGIAARAGCSAGLVSSYFGTMLELRRSVMRAAIKQGKLSILAAGLASGDANAAKAPDDLKQQALATLL